MSKDREFDDTNRWKLFREKEKKSDKHPDFTGEVNIEGTTYRLAGWVQEGKSGRFFTGSVTPRLSKALDTETIDDDIPF